MFPENKTIKCYFHFPPSRKIPRRNSICSVTPWPFMRSKNCLSSQENTSSKVLTLGIIFANCHDLSRVHLRVSWYSALCRVTLRGVRPRGVGLRAQTISARFNTGYYVFSFSIICIFILFLALSQLYVLIPSARSLGFGSRLWKVNIGLNWNLFYHYLFQRTPVIYIIISQENAFIFATYFLYNMKPGPDKYFCFVTTKNCLCDCNYARGIRL